MPADVYEAIRDEIMRLLDNEGGVSLPSFFEILLTGRAKKRVGICSPVKLDLQYKFFIIFLVKRLNKISN